jgi:hypothetical protein
MRVDGNRQTEYSPKFELISFTLRTREIMLQIRADNILINSPNTKSSSARYRTYCFTLTYDSHVYYEKVEYSDTTRGESFF